MLEISFGHIKAPMYKDLCMNRDSHRSHDMNIMLFKLKPILISLHISFNIDVI